MNRSRGALLLLVAVLLPLVTPGLTPGVAAAPEDFYPAKPFLGAGNLPLACAADPTVDEMTFGLLETDNPDRQAARARAKCHHMRTGLNFLDSPKIDVLVLVPVTHAPERDMRIARQSVEMWEGGIDYLAGQMGLDWLAQGVDFRVTLQYVDPTTGQADGPSGHPVIDPEIVVVAALNPVGGLGIGIDPVGTYSEIFTGNEQPLPCLPVPNPFDFDEWGSVPGFDNHHDRGSGTYSEDCGGMGGNVCYAVNTALDPAPDLIEVVSLFDLVSHEFGHCLTLGHVGDGAEGPWGLVPTNDIMAYHDDPPGLNKCVSTLDVEAFAARMSNYLDTDGSGTVDQDDRLSTNVAMDDNNPFQVQDPAHHLYASASGSPMECPQPDLGLVAGPRTNWTPLGSSVESPILNPRLAVLSPTDGAESQDGKFNVAGTVKRRAADDPSATSASIVDPEGDASSPLTEILGLDVAVTDSHLNATMRMAEVPPTTDGSSATSYTVVIDGRKFDSFPFGVGFSQPRTWDNGEPMADGTSSWNLDSNTVEFRIPRAYLGGVGITAPYRVASSANFGHSLAVARVDDSAPDAGMTLGVDSARFGVAPLPGVPAANRSETIVFENPPDEFGNVNTFYTEQSTLGVTPLLGLDPRHLFTLDLEQKSDVEFSLAWDDFVGLADLDLYVTGPGDTDSGTDGASTNLDDPTEGFILEDVPAGTLQIVVEPYLITDPLLGAKYSLTAKVTAIGGDETPVDSDGDGVTDAADECSTIPGIPPTGCPDTDGDGFAGSLDACPTQAGVAPDGCPDEVVEEVDEKILLFVNGSHVATQQVDTSQSDDRFAFPLTLAGGPHQLRVDWEENDVVIASKPLEVRSGAAAPPAGTPPVVDPVSPPGGSGPSEPARRPESGTRPPGLPEPVQKDPGSTESTLFRLQGNDRIDTAVSVSRASFRDGSAGSVVIARADTYADGLSGSSLAAAYSGPLLLTPKQGLDPRVDAELRRVLTSGGRVFLLGGPDALHPALDGQLASMGYAPTRIAGPDRFITAVEVAKAQPRPTTILLATGQSFADALSAGAAAGHVGGVVLLTDGPNMPAATAEYLGSHSSVPKVAIGGPASAAAPDAAQLIGADRFATSVAVARRFFASPRMVALASGATFADALSGGAMLGLFGGPVLLTHPTELSEAVANYLPRNRGTIRDLLVLGGESAVARQPVDDALQALRS